MSKCSRNQYDASTASSSYVRICVLFDASHRIKLTKNNKKKKKKKRSKSGTVCVFVCCRVFFSFNGTNVYLAEHSLRPLLIPNSEISRAVRTISRVHSFLCVFYFVRSFVRTFVSWVWKIKSERRRENRIFGIPAEVHLLLSYRSIYVFYTAVTFNAVIMLMDKAKQKCKYTCCANWIYPFYYIPEHLGGNVENREPKTY